MFQTFETTSNPKDGAPRLAQLRKAMDETGLDGFLVPRSDAFQGEYVAPSDERLAWLTGFTGSAGFCVALKGVAGVFIDGRYRLQVRTQVDTARFTPVHWPEVSLADWLKDQLPGGGTIGYDPWLHSQKEIATATAAVLDNGIKLRPTDNLVDRIWTDRPSPPIGRMFVYPIENAGQTHSDKRAEIARTLRAAGQRSTVLTLPDSIAWLLNCRGEDIARNPIAQAFAILHDDGRVDLFSNAANLGELADHFGTDITCHTRQDIVTSLGELTGPVRLDKARAPILISTLLADADIEISYDDDPCLLPKACKNATELAGTTTAHLRDAAAMIEFLCWLDATAPNGGLSEIDVVEKLEGFRRATNALRDISFETIAGTGPNGAVIHYRVSNESNRQILPGDLLLVDSGGQYIDGTTDITRTIAIGQPTGEQIACFTRVLQGMIAVSRTRFPKGITGAHLDALARAPLWLAGQDYDHGTGHGVGAYLSVHEGPQRLARSSDEPFKAGMILSNEPGYYRDGAFGIRIENLIVVEPAPDLPGADDRDMLAFRTLTFVPIDHRLIDPAMLAPGERAWINAYHAEVKAKILDRLSDAARVWLEQATAPI